MLCGAIEQTESASKVTSHKEGEQRSSVTRHIMAPLQRPPRQDVIKERISLSRFKTKKDDL